MMDAFPEKPFSTVKEQVATSMFCALAWVLSFTILLPFYVSLCLCSWLQDKFYARLSNRYSCPKIRVLRQKLFESLYREIGSNRMLKFLELGVGPGHNFPYYIGNHSVTLLDKNPNFRVYFEKRLKKYPHCNVDRTVIANAENMTDFLDEEFDVVVATHFFCSVTNPEAVLREIKRVLKPDGKFAFLEHVCYPKNYAAYWIQKSMTPLWKVYCSGCRLDQDWKTCFLKHFSNIKEYNIMYPTFLPMFFRSHVFGLASK